MTMCSIRNRSIFYFRPVRSASHGTKSLSHWGPKIWELVASDMKDLSTLTAFKKAIKQLKPHACPCRLCRTYIYRFRQLAYVAYVRNPTFIGLRMILDTRTLTCGPILFSMIFQSFQKFFNFSYKLFNKYFSLSQSICQFKVLVRK